jgi:hypothetical protein
MLDTALEVGATLPVASVTTVVVPLNVGAAVDALLLKVFQSVLVNTPSVLVDAKPIDMLG